LNCKNKKYLWFHAFLVASHCQNVRVFSKMGSKINSSFPLLENCELSLEPTIKVSILLNCILTTSNHKSCLKLCPKKSLKKTKGGLGLDFKIVHTDLLCE